VNRTWPTLENADNNQTFPAVTVQFSVPFKLSHLKPFEYFDTLYDFEFISLEGNGKISIVEGVACERVSGYSKGTLDLAQLRNTTWTKVTGQEAGTISICPKSGYLSYRGINQSSLTMRERKYAEFSAVKPIVTVKFVSRKFEISTVTNSTAA
jgi:hypothetical protein